jgi:hypothetical protein
MKTLNEIINQESVYLHNWNSKIDMIGDFEDIYLTEEEYFADKAPFTNESYWIKKKKQMTEAIKKYDNINVLFAAYGTDNYSGDAFVLFEQDGKLYEVNGSHCSCYGLEGQWEPEETRLDALEFRFTKGEMGMDDYSGNVFHDELCSFLGVTQ